MPRPWTAVCWLAAANSWVVACVMGGQAAFEFLRYGGLKLEAHPAQIDAGWEAVTLLIWLPCVALTAWRGMNREAAR